MKVAMTWVQHVVYLNQIAAQFEARISAPRLQPLEWVPVCRLSVDMLNLRSSLLAPPFRLLPSFKDETASVLPKVHLTIGLTSTRLA